MNKLKKNLRTMIELLIKQSKVDVLVVVQIYFYNPVKVLKFFLNSFNCITLFRFVIAHCRFVSDG